MNKDLPAGVLAAGLPAVVKRTKDQFAPEPSLEEKKAILNGIVSEFKEYASFVGIDAAENSIQIQENGVVIIDGLYRFDVFNHSCDKPVGMLAEECRRFFSRYGIRFKIKE